MLPSSIHTQRTTQHNDESEIKTTIEEDNRGDLDDEEGSVQSDDDEDFACSDLGNIVDDEDLSPALRSSKTMRTGVFRIRQTTSTWTSAKCYRTSFRSMTAAVVLTA